MILKVLAASALAESTVKLAGIGTRRMSLPKTILSLLALVCV